MGNPIRRVAVTGAAGYIGESLLRRLEREDAVERILAIDIRPLTGRHTAKVLFRQHDVTAPMAELLSEHRIEAVAHLAFVLKPSHRRRTSERVNVEGTASVVAASARAGVQHLLYLSSATVYGAHPENPPMLTEESPIRPVKGFQYGEDKARAEALLRGLTDGTSSLTATVLRACPVMGPRADNFIARAFSKPFLVGVTGCDPPMQLLHEDDLVEAMCRCLMEKTSGIYNLAGEGTIRWSEMVRAFGRKLVNLPAPVVYSLTGLTWALRLQGDSPACGLDFIRYPWTVSSEKIKRELGLQIRHSSEESWLSFVHRQLGPAPVDGSRGC